MMHTSSFDKVKFLEEKGLTIISIAPKSPDWYKGYEYKKLAPTADMYIEWKDSEDNDRYIKRFRKEILSKLDAEKVLNELHDLVSEKDWVKPLCFVCFGEPRELSHRHLVSKWFWEHDYIISEWGGCKIYEV